MVIKAHATVPPSFKRIADDAAAASSHWKVYVNSASPDVLRSTFVAFVSPAKNAMVGVSSAPNFAQRIQHEPLVHEGNKAEVAGITLEDLIAKVGDLKMPGEGFADDLEAVQSSQPKAAIPPWPF